MNNRKIRWAVYEDIYVKNECSLQELYDLYKKAFDQRDVSYEDLEHRYVLFQWETKRKYYKEMHQQSNVVEDLDRNIHTTSSNLVDTVTELVQEFIDTHYSEGIHSVDDIKKLTSALKDLNDTKIKLLQSVKSSNVEAEDRKAKAKKLSPKELSDKVKELEKLLEE